MLDIQLNEKEKGHTWLQYIRQGAPPPPAVDSTFAFKRTEHIIIKYAVGSIDITVSQ